MDVNFKDICRLKRFDFKNANFESLKHVLLLTPLSNGIHSVNCILFGICGMTLFLLLWRVNYKHSNRPPWISKDLAKDINKKKTLWRRIRNSKSPQREQKFRKLRQQIKNQLRYERRNYHKTSKRFWSFFSFKCKEKQYLTR